MAEREQYKPLVFVFAPDATTGIDRAQRFAEATTLPCSALGFCSEGRCWAEQLRAFLTANGSLSKEVALVFAVVVHGDENGLFDVDGSRATVQQVAEIVLQVRQLTNEWSRVSVVFCGCDASKLVEVLAREHGLTDCIGLDEGRGATYSASSAVGCATLGTAAHHVELTKYIEARGVEKRRAVPMSGMGSLTQVSATDVLDDVAKKLERSQENKVQHDNLSAISWDSAMDRDLLEKGSSADNDTSVMEHLREEEEQEEQDLSEGAQEHLYATAPSIAEWYSATISRQTRETVQLAQAFGTERLKYTDNWQTPTDLASFLKLPDDLRNCCDKIAWMMPEAYIGLRLVDNTTVIVHNYPGQATGHQLHLGNVPFEIVWPTVAAGFMNDKGKLSRAQHDAVVKAIHANISELLAPNVVAVFAASSLRVRNNIIPAPCIRIVVLSKGIIPFGSWVLPAVIDGFPVDVVDGSLPKLQMMRSEFPDYDDESINMTRPSRLNLRQALFSGSGIEVGDVSHTQRSNVGTFSGVVQRRSGGVAGLACAHVVNTGIGQVYRTHNLFGIDWLKKIVRLGQRIANAVVEGFVTRPEQRFVDCGLFALNIEAHTALYASSQPCWNNVFNIPRVPQLASVGKANANDMVYKHGIASGITNGTVYSDGYIQAVYPQGLPYIAPLTRTRYILRATHCFFIQRNGFDQFSKDGDSGALVFRVETPLPADRAPHATVLGVVFGGWDNEFVSFASHIHDVQDALDCDLLFS